MITLAAVLEVHQEQVSCGSTEGRTVMSCDTGNSATDRHEKETEYLGTGMVHRLSDVPVEISGLASYPITDSEYQASPAGKIAEAKSELRIILTQSHPSDDKIILEHVSEALRILEEV